MTESTVRRFRFDPPGPGFWELDPVHMPRPMTRYWTQMHPGPFLRGTSEFAELYGMLIGGLEMVYIEGFGYRGVRPAPQDEIPTRVERAASVFESRFWRQQLKEWNETFKPASVKTHRELQSVNPDDLSDADLSSYLHRCRDHHGNMIYQHMRFTAAAVVPTGDFLAHAGDWTGLSHADLLELLRGAAPVSAGSSEEFERMVEAVGGDSRARRLIESETDASDRLGSLRQLDGPAGAAIANYLDLVGNRLVDGFDISNPTALEMPDQLLRAIRLSVERTGSREVQRTEQVADARAKVPENARSMFDELLEEARSTYRLRDERGVFSDIWASGLMRRAALAAGRRVAAAGRIERAEHMIDADIDEMVALVNGAVSPAPEILAERAAFRAAHSAKDAPPTLGTPPDMPDLSGLPPGSARMERAVGIVLHGMFGASEAEHEAQTLRGLAASKGIYEGPARRVASSSEFDRIQKGDVLVTEATTEAFNILLPLLGGIVTDSGGLLSHAAIVAREYGIPGVVGTREATRRIADGVRVRVDGNAGEVTVLG